jgi:hypothetical protein
MALTLEKECIMPKFDIMPVVRRWLSQYPYAFAVLSTLAIVTLVVGTNGFAGVRRAVHTLRQRAEDRQLAREAGRYVWCFSHYTNSEGKLAIYGYWPGYRKQAVLRAYDTPTWLLGLRQQQKECFRSWQQAAEAADEIAINYPTVMINPRVMPRDADEEMYRQAVLTAVFDSPVESYRHRNATAAEQAAADRWCLSRLHTSDATIYHVPHRLGGRDAVEEVLNQLPDRSHLNHYMIDGTACFATRTDAIDWMKKYGFVPPAGISLNAWLTSVMNWLAEGQDTV